MKLKKIKIPQTRKLLPYALALTVLAVIIFMFFIYKGVLVFNVYQTNAKIMVSGRLITENKVSLAPGFYEIRVSAPGYVEFKKDLVVKSGNRFHLDINLTELPKAQALSSNKASFIQTDSQDNLYFLDNENTIMRLAENKLMAITPPSLSGVESLKILPDGQLAIIKKSDGLYLYDFKRYDLLHQEMTKLIPDVKNFALDPSGGKVIYVQHLQTGEKVLIKSYFNGQGAQIILNLKNYNLNNPELFWSADYNNLYLLENNLYKLDVTTLELTKLLDGVKTIKPDKVGKLVLVEKNDSTLIILSNEGNSMYDLQVKGSAQAASWDKANNFVVITKENGQLCKADLRVERIRAYQYEGTFSPNQSALLNNNLIGLISREMPLLLSLETGWN